SCLAIVVRARRSGLTSVAHCLLPAAAVPPDSITVAEALRYVDTTIALMLRAMALHGALFPDIEVKLFGGADSLGGPGGADGYHVGSRNVEMAHTALAARGLTVAASSVGGRRGRVIEVDSATGEVFVKKLPGKGQVRRRDTSL